MKSTTEEKQRHPGPHEFGGSQFRVRHPRQEGEEEVLDDGNPILNTKKEKIA